MELSKKILGIKLDSIKDSEDRINYYIKILDAKIEDCEKKVKEISQKRELSLFKKSKLKRIKLELEEYFQLHSQIFSLLIPFEKEKLIQKIENKNKACDELINKVLSTNKVLDQDNNLIELEEEIKLAFVEVIKKFKEVDNLSYQYEKEETDNWSISEELSFDGNSIGIVVTTDDYGIAAKHHAHIKTFEEVLQKFRLTQEKNNSIKKR